ncbi:restriction endonuclease subunit S [Helicobacter pylori]|nr:restriction endonuclease subunit S [Helicobacter pylori]WRE81834.1 restriction endonuclease subunit S [Helicobacter pylori]
MDALTTPSNWQRVRLGDILSYEQPTKYLVATTQYLQKGFTPILTAGKTFILGYTNDKHGIYTNIPVIIFDDFTTDSKMVNFPFKVKSSAIKILSLRDNNQADLKYIYEKLTLLKHQVTDHKRYWIDEFSNFEIPLPPLNEQIAIANILSDVDRYLYSLRALILKKESVKKALSFELLSQRKRLKGFNQNWQRVRLGDICEITTGSLDANEMVHYGKYRFYTCAKEYYFIDKYAFDTEAILISGNGAYVGYVHYYKGKFNAYQRTYVLDNFSEHIIFVKYFLTMFLQSHIQTNRNEGNTPYIVMATLKDFEILLPPLNEQIAIANILSDLDKEIASLKNKKRQFENIKKALNHDLMSAKIRVLKK